MNITIKRNLFTHEETMGALNLWGVTASFVCDTIERPDAGDQPGVSCIPVGTYDLVPHTSARLHEDDGITSLQTWALVNPSLGVTHNPDDPLPGDCKYPHRSDCLIHPANFADQLEGCIAVGNGRAMSGQKWMVTNSRLTFKALRAMLGVGTTGHTLTIEGNS